MAEPEKEKIKETIGEKPEMEVKTMKKDLTRLRLLESEQERDKIVELQKQEKTRKKDLERIEEFQKQKREKEKKRMRRIRLFRGKRKERPIPAKTETETPEMILEKPPLPPESLISAAPLPEFEKPSAPSEKPSAPSEKPSAPSEKPSAPSAFFKPAPAPLRETKPEPIPPELPMISAPPLPETEKLQPSTPPSAKEDLENQRKKLLKQRQGIIKALSLTVSEEKRAEQKIHLIEEEEAKPDLEDRQSIEKTRQHLEKQRNSIEQRRWQQEKQSQEIEQKIKEIDSELAKPAESVSIPKVPASEQDRPALPDSAGASRGKPVEPKSISMPLPKSQEKPLELPIAEKPLGPKLLPEQRLAQAKQRLASFKERSQQTEKELETKEIDEFKERLRQSAMPEKRIIKENPDQEKMFEGKVKIYRDIPVKQPKSQKLLMRIAFISVILLGIGVLAVFIYWLFTEWQANPEITGLPIITNIIGKRETAAPEPIIPIENKMVLEIFEDNELPAALVESLNKELSQGQFTVLNIKQGENFLNLNEFLRILEIQMPSEISERLEPKFTLFMYSIAESLTQVSDSDKSSFVAPNRLGFVAEIKENEQIYELMRSWEQSMENDTEKFFMALGKSQPASINVFNEAKYKETSFRYISFPQMDFGICWIITNNYLVFTSSGEAIIKTIDLINID